MSIIVTDQDEIIAANYGVVPGPDVTAALLCLVQHRPPGVTIRLPAGTLIVSAPTECNVGKDSAVWFRGAGTSTDQGTTLQGTFSGPLLAFNQAGAETSCSVQVEGIRFANYHAAGVGLQLEGCFGGYVRDCVFGPAYRGLIIGSLSTLSGLLDNWLNDVTGCTFYGDQTLHPAGVGCFARLTSGSFHGIICNHYAVGLQLTAFPSVFGIHAENCGCIVKTGIKLDGTDASEFNGVIAGISSEACAPNLIIAGKSTNSLVVSGYRALGTGNTDTGASPSVGIDCLAGSARVTLENVLINGGWTTAAVRLDGDGPVIIDNVSATTSAGGGAANWVITTPSGSISSRQSNNP